MNKAEKDTTTAVVWEKLQKGINISDEELLVAIANLRNTVDTLRMICESDKRFSLFVREIRDNLLVLENFQQARNL